MRRNKSKVAPATWRQREQHVRLHIKPSLGTRKVKDITTKHVEKMLDDLVRAGFHARTSSHVRATLSVALGEALREGLVAYNVAMGARTPKIASVEQGHLTAEQARKLIDSSRGSDLGELWLPPSRQGSEQPRRADFHGGHRPSARSDDGQGAVSP